MCAFKALTCLNISFLKSKITKTSKNQTADIVNDGNSSVLGTMCKTNKATSKTVVMTGVYREMILWKWGIWGLDTANWQIQSQSTFCCVRTYINLLGHREVSDWGVCRCHLF